MERFKRIDEIIVKMNEEDFGKLMDAYWQKALGGIDNFAEIIREYNITFDDVKYWVDYDD